MSATITDHIAPKGLTSITGLALQRAKRVEVVLGMAQHNCRFHGICRIEKQGAVTEVSDCGCRDTVPGWLLRPEPNYCVLMLWRGSLPADRETYHFNRKRIELNNALSISSHYPTRLGGDLQLRRGSYSIRATKDYYVLYLPLEMN
jgi:hypothetical protein